jgi:precorrin-2 dehydrogenase/sirohydrochlorin ferrochelatase
MAYFPMFFDLTDRNVLVVGGGAIAHEKLEKLVEFTKEITVITPEMSLETHTLIGEHCLTLYHRPYRTGDIDGFDMVIVATDGVALHKAIYEESRGSRVLVNSVDDTRYCDFIFPSFVKKGDLTLAFSTGGASPAFAKYIRRHFEAILPDGVEPFLEKMRRMRTELPKGKERMATFDNMVAEYFEKHFKR